MGNGELYVSLKHIDVAVEKLCVINDCFFYDFSSSLCFPVAGLDLRRGFPVYFYFSFMWFGFQSSVFVIIRV